MTTLRRHSNIRGVGKGRPAQPTQAQVARDMVATVSEWVREHQQTRRRETFNPKASFAALFAGQGEAVQA